MNDSAAKFDDDDDLQHLLADLALIHSFPRGGKRKGDAAGGGIDGATNSALALRACRQ